MKTTLLPRITVLLLLAFSCAYVRAFAYTPIEVTGVFMDEKKGNVALINGAPYAAGEQIEDVKILQITQEGVLCSIDGHQFFQKITENSGTRIPTSQLRIPAVDLKFPKIQAPKLPAENPVKNYVSTLTGSLDKAKNVAAVEAQKNKETEDMMNKILDGK